MTGKSQTSNILWRIFPGEGEFGNDKIASILGYGDLVQGNIIIKMVYYVEGRNQFILSKGYAQKEGIDFEESFAPVARLEAVGLSLIPFNMADLWYPKDTSFELTAFSDSDHAGCLDSCKSTSGGIQFLGGDNHSHRVAISPLFRTKHIDVRYHFIKEQVEKGIVELFFVGTEYQLADMFTKAQLEDRFKYLVRRLGMRCLAPDELEVLANESA
ncbi:hypothetical protein Tco_1540161 [Tanacetum coccineum]